MQQVHYKAKRGGKEVEEFNNEMKETKKRWREC